MFSYLPKKDYFLAGRLDCNPEDFDSVSVESPSPVGTDSLDILWCEDRYNLYLRGEHRTVSNATLGDATLVF